MSIEDDYNYSSSDDAPIIPTGNRKRKRNQISDSDTDEETRNKSPIQLPDMNKKEQQSTQKKQNKSSQNNDNLPPIRNQIKATAKLKKNV